MAYSNRVDFRKIKEMQYKMTDQDSGIDSQMEYRNAYMEIFARLAVTDPSSFG